MNESAVQLPANECPTIRILAMAADTNASGDIFGGWIMAQVDIAGSVVAHQLAQSRVVTVAVNSFHFQKPVFVGDLVSCYARVDRVGRTSITVDVEVFAQRGRDRDQVVQVTKASLTYVAIDDNRKPKAVLGDTAI